MLAEVTFAGVGGVGIQNTAHAHTGPVVVPLTLHGDRMEKKHGKERGEATSQAIRIEWAITQLF